MSDTRQITSRKQGYCGVVSRIIRYKRVPSNVKSFEFLTITFDSHCNELSGEHYFDYYHYPIAEYVFQPKVSTSKVIRFEIHFNLFSLQDLKVCRDTSNHCRDATVYFSHFCLPVVHSTPHERINTCELSVNLADCCFIGLLPRI